MTSNLKQHAIPFIVGPIVVIMTMICIPTKEAHAAPEKVFNTPGWSQEQLVKHYHACMAATPKVEATPAKFAEMHCACRVLTLAEMITSDQFDMLSARNPQLLFKAMAHAEKKCEQFLPRGI